MLVLASASPRRRELLLQIGLTFEVEAAEIDESVKPGEEASAYVLRLAEEKAQAVFARREQKDSLIVLGADTTVVCGGEILGKPADAADAARMLRLLSGQRHQVMTAVAVASTAGITSAVEVTEVEMNPLTDTQIAGYVRSGEPMGKAGAYAIQGRAATFIPRIEGCYFNVVGLPLARVVQLLEQASPSPIRA